MKYRKLKEEAEKILSDYHNHFFNSFNAMKKLRDVAKEMQEEDHRRNQLYLTVGEEAFDGILANHASAIQDYKLIKEIVKDVTKGIKKNAQQPD